MIRVRIYFQEFLNDYGMVWIGKSTTSHHHHLHSDGGGGGGGEGGGGGGGECSDMWSPSNSLPVDRESSIDFDLVIKNVKELNILAGEGSSEVTRTPQGAQLKVSVHSYISGGSGGGSLGSK